MASGRLPEPGMRYYESQLLRWASSNGGYNELLHIRSEADGGMTIIVGSVDNMLIFWLCEKKLRRTDAQIKEDVKLRVED